jgi:hypothetical protein
MAVACGFAANWASSTIVTALNLPDNPIVCINPAFEYITGYCTDEAQGHKCRFLRGKDRSQPASPSSASQVRTGFRKDERAER